MSCRVPKYKFKINTSNKIVVDNINIISNDQKSAEVRLAQLYLKYEILEVEVMNEVPLGHISFEKIIDLISK